MGMSEETLQLLNLLFRFTLYKTFSLVSAHGAVPLPLSGATKEANRSFLLTSVLIFSVSLIPPPTANLPKHFGFVLYHRYINDLLHRLLISFYLPALAVSAAGEFQLLTLLQNLPSGGTAD